MAEAVLSTVVETITKHLTTLVYQKIQQAGGLEDQLANLKDTLSAIKSVVLDAEEQQFKDREVQDWLGKLKDAMYDADDVLDEYEFHNIQQQVEMYGGLINKVCNCLSSSDPILFRLQLGQEIQNIKEKIDKIALEKFKFQLPKRSFNEQGVQIKREQTHSFVRESNVIGRDKDKDDIIKLLKSYRDNENVSIIPIVGIGGLGKTALAQLVYNDNVVDQHFDFKLWVCVSEEFSVRYISQRILEKLTYTDFSHWDLDFLQIFLRGKLNTKRYLLVLDDVWNEDRVKWVGLKELLMDGAKGSKIIVTTRNKKVATMMGTITPYNLKGLPDDDCLALLLKWAFEDGQERQYPNLVKIGKDIVKKCGGLPLAARTLGSLLYKKTDEREWLLVKDNEIWEIVQGENDILPVLRLTYDHMPSYLKQCFAFCSLFPKDSTIDKETLIHLWMAQGFLQSSDESQQLENIGNSYFNELLSRSLFEDAGEGYNREIINCRMHDLVHDLARSVAGNECLIMTPQPKNLSGRVRHVSIFGSPSSKSNNEDAISRLLLSAKKLRTFYSTVLVGKATTSLLANLNSTFKHLRILRLSKSDFEDLPSSIGNLLHLRYFDLSENVQIRKLPNSICKLRNMQKLKLYACAQLQELPRDIWKMYRLRHLELTSQQVYLPEKGIEGLTSLRSLSIRSCNHLSSLAKGIQHLTTLQVLRLCDCPSLTLTDFSLNSLTSLETLEIRNCQELDLVMRRNMREKDSLKGHKTLQSLLIEGLNYMKVELMEKKKKRKEDPEVQQKRKEDVNEDVKEQEKQEDEGEGEEEEEIFQEGLQSLRWLIIAGLPKLNTLPQGLQNAASSLQYISITDCRKFYKFPDWRGNFTSLWKLEIINCPVFTSFPEGMRLTALQILRLCDCPSLTLQEFILNSLSSLETLEIRNCFEVDLAKKRKRREEDDLKRRLIIGEDVEKGEKQEEEMKKQKGEEKEVEVEIGWEGFERLQSLIIAGLPKLTTLPRQLQNAASSLQYLSIADCKNFYKLPDWLGNFTSLRKPEITNCPKLSSLPEGIRHLSI